MKTPAVLGRNADESVASPRSSTTGFSTASVEYEGAAAGKMEVHLFQSDGDEDRGGFVLRFSGKQTSASFIPTSRDIEEGCEVHIAGDDEGAALLKALQLLIGQTLGGLAERPSNRRGRFDLGGNSNQTTRGPAGRRGAAGCRDDDREVRGQAGRGGRRDTASSGGGEGERGGPSS